jgi:hypothetical protein
MGPYTPWWTSRVFRDYMDKKYNYDWDKPTTTFEKFLDKLEDALQWVYSHTVNPIFARMKRKIKVKIHDYDVWGLDNTLAHIILPALILLKEQKHGTPHTDRDDAPADAIYNDKHDDEDGYNDGFSIKRWEYIMDEMMHAFACELDEDWEDQFATGNLDIRWEKKNPEDKFSTMVNGPNHTYDVDYDAKKKAWDRRQNGLRLFAKYYHSLWD